jgi:hypothetical protein
MKIDFDYLDAEDHMDEVEKYGVVQTPTLVSIDHGKVMKFDTLPKIEDYVKFNF